VTLVCLFYAYVVAAAAAYFVLALIINNWPGRQP